jgi:S-adenosylmethionine:tRNA ribosyltransferase-isomerase
MRLDLFDYPLPESAIAQHPLPRGTTRLLVCNRKDGSCRDAKFSDLPGLLPPGALLVINDTKVIPARLPVRLAGGGKGEIFLLKREGPLEYLALVRPGRKFPVGKTLPLEEGLNVRVLAAGDRGKRHVAFSADPAGLLRSRGRVPLPPYIRREDTPEDRTDYQTVYAREEGSVAAPTAGLHFTEGMLDRLRGEGILISPVTLHVGTGTFRPVTSETLEDHQMDREACRIPEETAQTLREARRKGWPVIGVGTTVCRTLESRARACGGDVTPGEGETDLFITPGFPFRVLDGLLTNFHLPRSTPLVLVSAFAGRENVLAWYNTALHHGYRFLSYGDAMLVL